MDFKRRFCIVPATVLSVLFLIVSGCSSESRSWKDAGNINLCGTHTECNVLAAKSDAQVEKYIESQMKKLKEAGKLTDPNTLKEQKRHKKCKLDIPRAQSVSKEPAQIYKDYAGSVVVVCKYYYCSNCVRWHCNFASGFVITPDGVIVTNYHVIEDNGEYLGIMTFDGRVLPVAEILAVNPADDLAIIRVDEKKLKPIPLAENPVEAGMPIIVISHPDSHFYAMSSGLVSRCIREEYHKGQVSRLEITADYARGSSGGPVIDEKGNVVGVVRTTDSIYYEQQEGKHLQMVVKTCIPSTAIRSMIK